METNAEAIYGHLLFHRAIIDEGDRSEKIERYMELLRQAEAGEGIVPLDPVDRAVQLVFQLVLSNNFDPWDVNLMEFVRMYTKKMHADEVNFIVAGKLVHMAWSILRMQSHEVLLLHERPEQFELICADWDLDGDGHSEEPFHSDIVTDVPDGVELAEAVRHHTQPTGLVGRALGRVRRGQARGRGATGPAEGPGRAQGSAGTLRRQGPLRGPGEGRGDDLGPHPPMRQRADRARGHH